VAEEMIRATIQKATMEPGETIPSKSERNRWNSRPINVTV